MRTPESEARMTVSVMVAAEPSWERILVEAQEIALGPVSFSTSQLPTKIAAHALQFTHQMQTIFEHQLLYKYCTVYCVLKREISIECIEQRYIAQTHSILQHSAGLWVDLLQLVGESAIGR